MEKVKLAGVNTSKLPVLSNEMMVKLFKEMDLGGLEAREELISGNLRLVLSVLQRFRGSKHGIDDLFQIGCVGLVKAIDNFDIKRGHKFSTYAVPMIIGEIKRYLRDNRKIRVSRSLRNKAYRALKLKDRLRRENHREPTLSEVAERLNLSCEEIVHALEATKTPLSLYRPVFEDEGQELYLIDQLGDNKADWSEAINLQEAFKGLSTRERFIINLKFYEGWTQAEIAEEIGVSQAQISRIQKRALKKLQQEMEVKNN